VTAYRKAVESIADAIAAGALYQACLTYRVDRPFAGDPWRLYTALRRRDPAPFAAYLELPEVAVVAAHPSASCASKRWAASRAGRSREPHRAAPTRAPTRVPRAHSRRRRRIAPRTS
jgi:para-aminobenzoate synthetase component 1